MERRLVFRARVTNSKGSARVLVLAGVGSVCWWIRLTIKRSSYGHA
jgi:hypothetical protein